MVHCSNRLQIDVEVEAAMCDVMPGLNAPHDAAEIVPESSELANMQESLWFEDRNGPPALSDTEMSKLDEVADDVEIQRLIAKGVIRRQEPEDSAGQMQKLSTKFVRTWRAKRKANKSMQLRRSRLVAREYRWLDSTREGLFSPSTSRSIVRLLPLLFCVWRATRPGEQIVLATIDIKDAFLEVPQEHPVIAGLPSDYTRPKESSSVLSAYLDNAMVQQGGLISTPTSLENICKCSRAACVQR